MLEENKRGNDKEKLTDKLHNSKIKTFNITRTKLLIYIDDECNQYIRNCKVRFNNQLPKEISKIYNESCLVSFSNPIITNFNQFEPSSKIGNKGENMLHDNISSLKFNSNPSVFNYTQCLVESGKEFINQRKINVSYKKLDNQNNYLDNMRLSNYLSNNSNAIYKSGYTRGSLIQIDPLDSKIRSKSNLSIGMNSKSKAFIFPNLKKNLIEEFFLKREEREAKKIQKKFNRLQNLAKKLKNPENDNFDFNIEKNKEFSSVNTNFNGELFDMLQFKGFNFDSNIIKQKQINNSRKFSKGLTNKCDNFKNMLSPGLEINKEANNKFRIKCFNLESCRNSENIFHNNHVKNSDNTIKNPFARAADNILNANGSTPRRKIKRKPINNTTKESNKLAAIIKKIRHNLFQLNQRNSYDSNHSIAEENQNNKQEKKFNLNLLQQRDKSILPFEVYTSDRESINNDQYSNHYQKLNFYNQDEEGKKFVDSSEDVLSDNERNSQLSFFSNLYQKKSLNHNNKNDINLNRGNLFNFVKKKEKNKFPNLRSIYNSNLSKYSEVSIYSNSIADSVTCSIISKDPSNITKSSITKSEFSIDYDV